MRVTSSLRSWESFCNSTRANAPILRMRPPVRWMPRGARISSTGTARRPSAGTDFVETPFRRVFGQVRPRVVTEHVLQGRVGGGVGAQGGLQVVRCADGLQDAVVHQCDAVAQRVGLLHVMRGEQYG